VSACELSILRSLTLEDGVQDFATPVERGDIGIRDFDGCLLPYRPITGHA
jgi:hypothetical protein